MNILSLIFILANNIINLSVFPRIISLFLTASTACHFFSRFMNGHYAHFVYGMRCVVFGRIAEINQYRTVLHRKKLFRKSSLTLTENLNIYYSRCEAQNFLVTASFPRSVYKKCVAQYVNCVRRHPNTQKQKKRQRARHRIPGPRGAKIICAWHFFQSRADGWEDSCCWKGNCVVASQRERIIRVRPTPWGR